jgi:hypothetical protein
MKGRLEIDYRMSVIWPVFARMRDNVVNGRLTADRWEIDHVRA